MNTELELRDKKTGVKGVLELIRGKFVFSKPVKLIADVISCQPTIMLRPDRDVHEILLTQNCTISLSDEFEFGDPVTIILRQDSTGSRTVSFGSNFLFSGGVAPTITITAAAIDVVGGIVDSQGKVLATVSQAHA